MKPARNQHLVSAIRPPLPAMSPYAKELQRRADVRFCPRCGKDTLVNRANGRCLWCSGETK